MTGVLEPRVTVLMTASLALFQVTLTPYMPEPGVSCRDPKEYYNNKVQMCCAACPPGERQMLGVWTVMSWRECLSRNGEEGLKFSLGCS